MRAVTTKNLVSGFGRETQNPWTIRKRMTNESSNLRRQEKGLGKTRLRGHNSDRGYRPDLKIF